MSLLSYSKVIGRCVCVYIYDETKPREIGTRWLGCGGLVGRVRASTWHGIRGGGRREEGSQYEPVQK